MKITRYTAACLTLAVCMAMLASCRGQNGDSSSNAADGVDTEPGSVVVNGTVIEPTTGNADASAEPETAPETKPAEVPSVGDYTPAGETVITLGEFTTVEGEGATAEGDVVTVTRAGTYLVSGTAADGQIIVDTTDESKVILLLNGASLSCSTGPAIFIRSAPKKVVISTVAGSVNILSDGTGYVVPDEEQTEGEIYPNACIYSCEDLDLDGTGELHITGNADKGINTKDDLKIKSGTLTVTSVGVGIRANDSLEMSGGTVTVNSGGDGVKTANTETEGKGYLTVEGGSLYITAKGDGLSAATDLTVSSGNLVLTTTDIDGEVLKESTGNPTSGSMGGGFGGMGGGGRPGGPGGMGGMGESSADKAAISAKGLKAAGILTVKGGKITIIAQDDGIHSDGDVHIADGTLHIRAADDGIHAEKELTVSGGVLTVAQSYEGLEALHINILGGTNRITSSDDGANATNGTGGGMMGGPGGMGGGWWGQSSNSGSTDTTVSTETPVLTFAGGYTVFNAAGDGIDSNGNIVMAGGTVIVYGPTDNGNGPIDFGDGNYGMTVSGGTFLAVGSSGMAESAENAGQAVLAAYWRGTGLSAGEIIGITDKDGKVLAAFELPKAISSVVFSSPDLVAGTSYSIVGGGSATGTVVDGVIDPATYTGYESMGEIQAY
ncbi:MAG: carbohydrate-binding domain-containing protein [Clostridia bacterium]|nr:carbohydrate-binding domain-containing protein [Clostridia bacterium]